MSMDEPVGVRQDARGVAWVTIQNAAKLNTLNQTVMTALVAAIENLAGDGALRAVVLRGAGERAFIGGADIAEMAKLDPASGRAFITLVHRSCEVFRRLPVPAIACIQGWTLGAGLEVAAACDLRIAAGTARFGMPEVRVGIPSVVEAALLPGLIGWGRTRRLLLTGETIDAATALSWGLVEEVVPPAQLEAAVEKVLGGILASGPRAIRLQKALIADWETLTLEDAIQRGIDSFAGAWETDEPRGLMNRFLEFQRQRKR
ncbi:MAG TPA: enoyl-CoA hydratase [Acetobacteraceae bacterium]|nr:enoyl-CoA hydratase [Acetobacteraceae bacterium]